MNEISGYVDECFGLVFDAFKKNFTQNKEIGAACTIYVNGKKVVDLWGGYIDSKKKTKWEEDTLVPVFSTTKGITALTIAVAVSRGLFSYDDFIMDIWHDFGKKNKNKITVRQLLAHQAGLCALNRPIDLNTLNNHTLLSQILADQAPEWEPGDYQGYHCWDLGWFQSELIRHSDAKRRSLGIYFNEEIGKKLGIDFFIGLPDNISGQRIAELKSFNKILMPFKMPLRLVFSFFNPKSLTFRTMGNPRFLLDHLSLNRRKYQKVEIGSGNGIGNSRSIARLHSVFSLGGNELNIKREIITQLESPPVPPKKSPKDLVLHTEIPFSLGFMKPNQVIKFGSSKRAYGFWGAGGSCGFADPDVKVGYSYVMNKMGGEMFSDPREENIRSAFYRCLKYNFV